MAAHIQKIIFVQMSVTVSTICHSWGILELASVGKYWFIIRN